MITTGELLKKTREKKSITIESIEEETKIRKKYLIAAENNEWNIFPSRTYCLGVVRTYGDYLGIDKDKLSAFFRREYEKKESSQFRKKIDKSYFTPKTIRLFKIGLIILFLPFILYFLYQIKLYFTPPNIILTSPKSFTRVRKDKILLIGTVDPETIVYVNGERVYPDEKNNFKTYVTIFSKKQKIIIEATGPNGRKTTLEKIVTK